MADLKRYAILLEEGGVIAATGSLWPHPVNVIITGASACADYEYTVQPTALISSFMASEPGTR